MKTIKEYAKEKGCSYENIRKLVKKHEKEISTGLVKKGKVTLLDDVAIAYLDNIVKSPKQSVLDSDTIKIISEKEKEIESLKAELEERNQIILKIQEQYNSDKARYLEEKDRYLQEKEKFLQAQLMIEQKDQDIKLIVSSWKKRREYKKELKRKEKNTSME